MCGKLEGRRRRGGGAPGGLQYSVPVRSTTAYCTRTVGTVGVRLHDLPPSIPNHTIELTALIGILLLLPLVRAMMQALTYLSRQGHPQAH